MNPETILRYWFGPLEDDLSFPSDKASIWWGKGHDDEIKAQFGPMLEAAKSGELDAWKEEPRSMLALILLFDQITRTVHRGSPDSFASDPKARALTYEAIERGFDQALRPVERVFVYMPLMHSEALSDHDEALRVFGNLVQAVPEGSEIRNSLSGNLNFEHKHRDIIVKFGRYPHRNAILGRPSTPEEEVFLTQPGSSF